MPSARQALVGGAAASIGVGVLRGCVQVVLAPRPVSGVAGYFVATIALTLIWAPVSLWIAVTWRWHSQRLAFFAAHVAGLATVICAEPLWVNAVLIAVRGRGQPMPYATQVIGRLDTNSLFYLALGAAVWVMDYSRRHGAARLAAARLDTVLADARLHVLTLQLHPHFLFNTLNLISQLAYRDLVAGRRTLANLRALLVESLAQAGQRDVSLGDELRFLGAYLEIQQRRFGDRLRVVIAVSDRALDAAVPHLLLQPLVENAIAHGIGDRARGGEIRIGADVAGGRLLLTVEDDGAGVAARIREGVGIANTRLRLQQISNDDYRFVIGARATGGTMVSIALPFRSPSPLPRSSGGPAGDYENTNDYDLPAPRRQSHARLAAQIAAGWAAVAMLWTELDAAGRVSAHRPLAWGTSLASSVVSAAVWALLTPIVVFLARRFDLVERRSPARIALHVGAASVAALTHVAIYLTTLRAFIPEQYVVERQNMFAWGLWDLVAYMTILSFASVVTLGAYRREAAERMAVTRARLSRARIASLRLRLQPGVLLAGLDAIDRQMALDPERAEHAIARMGDLLRLLLARADDDVVSLASEIALLRAYLEITGSDTPVDVDVPDALAVPAELLTPLATSLHAVVAVTVRVDDGELFIDLSSLDDVVDDARVAEVRERLASCFGSRWALDVGRDPEAHVHLRIPISRRTRVELDEDAPALVVA